MGLRRTHLLLPEEVLAEIDAKAGPRGRSALVTQILKTEFNRQRLLEFLNSKEPAWKDEDHPELAEGSYKWVRSLRDDWDRRVDEKFAKSDRE